MCKFSYQYLYNIGKTPRCQEKRLDTIQMYRYTNGIPVGIYNNITPSPRLPNKYAGFFFGATLQVRGKSPFFIQKIKITLKYGDIARLSGSTPQWPMRAPDGKCKKTSLIFTEAVNYGQTQHKNPAYYYNN